MLQIHHRMKHQFNSTYFGFLWAQPEGETLVLFVRSETGHILPCVISGLDLAQGETGPLKSQSFQLGWDDEEEDYDFEYEDEEDDDDDDLFDDSDDLDDDFDDDYDDLDDEIDEFDEEEEDEEEEEEDFSEDDDD
ncbi:MAG: hypothetical protein RBU29_07000 [bacterium]|jgi:hypothetical protein|nr:hypothetical protein [bacterium]